MASKFEDRAVRYITDLIRDFKLEDYQAAGFPGNFGVETGGFEHVQEINPLGGGRGGLGDAQWTGPRRRTFEAWLARNPGWSPSDYGANYSMLFRELEGEESGALDAVRMASNVDEATEIVMRRYERPGIEHLDRRKEYGRQALTAFRAAGIDVAALKAQGRPGAAVAVPLPNPGTAPIQPGNPIAGVIGFLQGHEAEARKITLTVVGIHNALYPADQIVVQAPAPVTPAKPVSERPSIAVGLLGLLGSLGLMGGGVIGTPFGMGAAPTGAGTAAVAASVATTVLGLFGGWGSIAKLALPLVGKLGGALAGAAKK